VNPFWVVPVVVLVAGAVVLLSVLRDAARAARELHDEVGRFAAVREPLEGLAEETSELRRGLERHRQK
jgi:hypothetical protein